MISNTALRIRTKQEFHLITKKAANNNSKMESKMVQYKKRQNV